MFIKEKQVGWRPDSDVAASCKTYNKVIRVISVAWEDAYGEPLVVNGGTPTERFQNAMEQLAEKMQFANEISKLFEPLDVDTPDDLKALIAGLAGGTASGAIRDVGDLTPNQVKQAIRAIASQYGNDSGNIDVPMNVFLRNVLNLVADSASIRLKMNVGRNRHFPRLLQWLRECEEETIWDDGQGIRIKNSSGTGRVSQYPTDPKKLKITINGEFL